MTDHEVFTNEALETLLTQTYPDIQFRVTGDGRHFGIYAVGAVFKDLSRLKRQQFLYKTLQPLIQAQKVHAVNLTLLTPEEEEAKRG